MRYFQNTRLVYLFILPLSILCSGACSQHGPVASNPPLYSQEKIQAIDHWDNIADKIANRLVATYEKRNDLIAKPVYIKRPNDLPFSIAFQNLLKTRLVSKGMQVTSNLGADSVTLEYDAQLILFDDSLSSYIPSLRSLGIAVISLISGKFTSASNHELIINARASSHGRYVMHLSTLCYINDNDWALYASPRGYDENFSSTRIIQVTSR